MARHHFADRDLARRTGLYGRHPLPDDDIGEELRQAGLAATGPTELILDEQLRRQVKSALEASSGAATLGGVSLDTGDAIFAENAQALLEAMQAVAAHLRELYAEPLSAGGPGTRE